MRRALLTSDLGTTGTVTDSHDTVARSTPVTDSLVGRAKLPAFEIPAGAVGTPVFSNSSDNCPLCL
jgi:hypothetical protein